MFGSLGTPELIIILVVVLLVFGVGRISKLGSEMGRGIKAFREGVKEGQDESGEDVVEPAEKVVD